MHFRDELNTSFDTANGGSDDKKFGPSKVPPLKLYKNKYIVYKSKLEDYIKSARKAGMDDDTIATRMRASGFDQTDAHDHLLINKDSYQTPESIVNYLDEEYGASNDGMVSAIYDALEAMCQPEKEGSDYCPKGRVNSDLSADSFTDYHTKFSRMLKQHNLLCKKEDRPGGRVVDTWFWRGLNLPEAEKFALKRGKEISEEQRMDEVWACVKRTYVKGEKTRRLYDQSFTRKLSTKPRSTDAHSF